MGGEIDMIESDAFGARRGGRGGGGMQSWEVLMYGRRYGKFMFISSRIRTW